MNREDLASLAAKRTGFTIKTCTRVIDTVFDIITESVAEGERVQVTGFGSFDSRKRVGRRAVDPQDTSSFLEVPSKMVPVFSPGSKLKRMVEKGDLSK